MRFANDVRLVWRNAKRYNKEGSGVWAAADRLAKAFECLLERWVMGPWRAKRCDFLFLFNVMVPYFCYRVHGTLFTCSCRATGTLLGTFFLEL